MKNSLLLIITAILILIPGCNKSESTDKSADSSSYSADAKRNSVNIPDLPDDDDEDIDVTPVTQYSFVDIGDYGPYMRDADKVAAILRNFGFTVENYPNNNNDEMASHLAMQATRMAGKKRTVIKYYTGEDNEIKIHFATQKERDDFKNSLEASKYNMEHGIYRHPQNNMGKIYLRIAGLEAKIIQPFEMLPNNF